MQGGNYMQDFFTRSNLEKKFGITRSQIDRMKETDLLIPSWSDPDGNKQKYYKEEKLMRLFYICLLRRMEFTTPEIKKLIGTETEIANNSFETPSGEEFNKIFDKRIAEMEEKIRLLSELVLFAKVVKLKGFENCPDIFEIADMTFDEYLDYINLVWGDGYKEDDSLSENDKHAIEMNQRIAIAQEVLFSSNSSEEEKYQAAKSIEKMPEMSFMAEAGEKLQEIVELEDKTANSQEVQSLIEDLYQINLKMYQIDENAFERLDFVFELLDRFYGGGMIDQAVKELFGEKKCQFLYRALKAYMNNELEKKGIKI